jgi:mono/diheme cytochrome c family protein
MACRLLLILIVVCLPQPRHPLAASESEGVAFEKHIRPIFRAHCYDCHGATEELEGGLDLRLVRLMRKGGDSGAAVVPGEPDESYLLERLVSGEMPPGEHRVPDNEIATVRRWIAAGVPTARPEPESIGPGLGITPEERSFWSFQPIRRPDVPEPSSFPPEARVRTPIDALILGRVPDGSSFSPDADRFTLVRRAYFDLIGLPPSPEEMQNWLDAPGDDWYDRLITELLDSPHYGERWARHWLDVAGYADSEGYTVADSVRPWAWKYRDWVIRALNDDKPLDQFIIEQLAGDELAGQREGDLTSEQIDLITATGFLRMAADGTDSGADTPAARNQVVNDTLKIVGTSLLGLSMQCAECHDHRYDPIPQTDYYSLRAIFEPALDWKAWKRPRDRMVSLYTEADRRRAAEVEAEAQKIAAERKKKQDQFISEELEKQLQRVEDESLRGPLREAYRTPADKRTDEQNKLLATYPFVRQLSPGQLYLYNKKAADELKNDDKTIAEVRAKKPAEEFLRALIEPPNHVPETKLFFRGDHEQPKQTVMPASLTVSAPEGRRHELPKNDDSLPTTGRRLAFAKWLTGGQHPLVARVIVNRVWMHHFGRGIVNTPADFGKLGARPSHPDLLDWLADEFVRQGWSLKTLHRLILTSTVWRQSSRTRSIESGRHEGEHHTPHSAYLRKPLVRLEAETIRDRVLAASGQLDRKLFGAPVGIKEDETGQVVVDGEGTRRSLYIQVRRSRPVAMLQAFDAPVMETNCEFRPVSTVATQSLMLMNAKFVLEQAAKLAERAAREAKPLSPEMLSDLPKLPAPREQDWRFGYGHFDNDSGRTVFQELPHWTGSAWQGGPKLPDPKLGWVTLNATGGHPGTSAESAIRRWIAPTAGVISVTGSLQHGSDKGNGIRGRIVSSRSGLANQWTAHNTSTQTPVAELAVSRRDTIDFVADCIDDHGYDSFNWPVTITLRRDDHQPQQFAAKDGFHGPTESTDVLPGQIVRAWQLAFCRKPTADELELAAGFLAKQLELLDNIEGKVPEGQTAARQALTNLCQALLCSNEFLYVD